MEKIFNSPLDVGNQIIFINLSDFIWKRKMILKMEHFNFSGSIKFKSALQMIKSLEHKNLIVPRKSTIIESTSGNLGVALAFICKQKGYKFICVTDPNISSINYKLINSYGGKIICVQEKDINGGYLNTRINLIKRLADENKNIIWTNQYANQENPKAHYITTATEIYQSVSNVDYLFIGSGTTGTLTGCAHYFSIHSPKTKIIAVDAKGSVTFQNCYAKRYIPGIGTSRKPEIATKNNIDDILFVSEEKTIQMCHEILEKYGLLIGASTGSVLSGVKQYENKISKNSTVVAISPDSGERYLDTVYDAKWVNQRFPKLNINCHQERIS